MSGVPFVQHTDVVYGAPERCSPLVRRITARNPGPFTYTGTGTYIVGGDDGALAVIDPGPDIDEHMNAIEAVVGGGRVSHILVTHTHRDHCAAAARLAAAVRAPIFAYGPHPAAPDHDAPALDEGGDYAFAPDHLLSDGDAVRGEGWTIEAVHTPGHLSNHLCFALAEERALFTGDHIMGWATTVIVPPEGRMGDYFDSLEKLLERNDERYYPTHGAPIDKPLAFVRAVRAHRRMRDGQILETLKAGPTTIPAIVARLYADIDKRLHPAAALNVLAHLIRLVDAGAARADGEATMAATYRAAG